MRVRSLLAVFVVAVALVAGCASPQQANETLPTATSASASPTPTLEPLGPPDFPVPEEARQPTAAGAEAALRYYMTLIGRQAGVDGTPLRRLSQDCRLCNSFAEQTDAEATAAIAFKGGDIAVAGRAVPAITGSIAEFSFTVDQSEVVATDASGQLLPDRSADAVNGIVASAAMAWSSTDQAWIMTDLIFE